ncbi:MAG: CPBP family intramembrane metalloprotease [Anaerolineales bacterium]|nr:CPBP family intramembrane metalloprotease [Anaerolineales bacterium]
MTWFNHSKLFDLARRGQRLPHIAVVVPLAFLFTLIAQFGAFPLLIPLGLVYGFTATGVSLAGVPNTLAGFWMSLQLVSSFILAYVILWAWLKWVEKRPFWTLGYEVKGALCQYGRGFLIGACMFAGAVGILSLFGGVSLEQGDLSKQGLPAVTGVLLVLVGWVIQGGAEEALIRGWVLPVIGARYKPWIGLLVSALIFSVLHGLNPGLNAIALINLALFGVFAGLYAMREGSLWGISALHSVWNWVQGNFFGFQVSGMNADGGTLINLMETGADWFTGGAFGPEGGLAVTIILALGIVVTLFWKSKSANSSE